MLNPHLTCSGQPGRLGSHRLRGCSIRAFCWLISSTKSIGSRCARMKHAKAKVSSPVIRARFPGHRVGTFKPRCNSLKRQTGVSRPRNTNKMSLAGNFSGTPLTLHGVVLTCKDSRDCATFGFYSASPVNFKPKRPRKSLATDKIRDPRDSSHRTARTWKHRWLTTRSRFDA